MEYNKLARISLTLSFLLPLTLHQERERAAHTAVEKFHVNITHSRALFFCRQQF
jgi:hypothetical protein